MTGFSRGLMICDALKSTLGNTTTSVSSRADPRNKFQRERGRNRDFKTKIILAGPTRVLCRDLRYCLGPDAYSMRFHVVWSILYCDLSIYHQLAIGTQAGLRGNERHAVRDAPRHHHWNPLRQLCVASVSRWSRPEPTIAEVQRIPHATSSATLLAPIPAIFGKQ